MKKALTPTSLIRRWKTEATKMENYMNQGGRNSPGLVERWGGEINTLRRCATMLEKALKERV